METPTAIDLALPGLEVRGVTSDPSPEHFIMRGTQKRLMVFAGRSHPELARSIAERHWISTSSSITVTPD